LIDALEKFELDRGIKFETYAIPRIRGAIIDELRSLDWVPRSVRFKHREFEKAYAEVESRLKRAPSDREIAEHLGISLGELHDIVTQISSVSILALDEPVSVGSDRGETISLMDTLTDVAHGDLIEGLEGDEMRAMLSTAINSLSDREKIVVTLYYFEGLTLSEIGDVLGVTESRVCQIHTKAVGVLRVRLTDRVVTIPTRCPHKGAPLVDGRILRGTFLECPWHGATFDLRTGRRLRGPECADLATVEGT